MVPALKEKNAFFKKKYTVQLGKNVLMGSTSPVTDKGKCIPYDSYLF